MSVLIKQYTDVVFSTFDYVILTIFTFAQSQGIYFKKPKEAEVIEIIKGDDEDSVDNKEEIEIIAEMEDPEEVVEVE